MAQNIRNFGLKVDSNLQQFLGDKKNYDQNLRLEKIRGKFYGVLD